MNNWLQCIEERGEEAKRGEEHPDGYEDKPATNSNWFQIDRCVHSFIALPPNAHVQRRAARRTACVPPASGVTRECGRCNGLLAREARSWFPIQRHKQRFRSPLPLGIPCRRVIDGSPTH